MVSVILNIFKTKKLNYFIWKLAVKMQ